MCPLYVLTYAKRIRKLTEEPFWPVWFISKGKLSPAVRRRAWKRIQQNHYFRAPLVLAKGLFPTTDRIMIIAGAASSSRATSPPNCNVGDIISVGIYIYCLVTPFPSRQRYPFFLAITYAYSLRIDRCSVLALARGDSKYVP